MCEIDFDEPADVWRVERPVARKEHRCDVCHGPVPKGEKYMKISFVGDGTATTEKVCPPCTKIMDFFTKEHHATPCPSTFLEYVENCGGAEWDAAAAEIRARVDVALARRSLGAIL